MEHFSTKERHPENDRIAGETDGKVSTSTESDRYGRLTEVESGPAVLSPEDVQAIDSALNIAGFGPEDLQYADQERLQQAFALLSSSGEKESKKEAMEEIIALVRLGVG